MEHREIEEKIRTAVKQTAPNQLEDILSRCEGDTEAPVRLPKSTRRRPALAALAALVLVALGLGLFPVGEGTFPTLRRREDPNQPTAPVAAATTSSPLPTDDTGSPVVSSAAVLTPAPSAAPVVFPANSPVPTATPSVSPAPEYIGTSAALHAALLALDLDYEELPYHSEELDWDDGVAVYEVDICHNGIEYSCEIDACTGDCRGWEQDICDHPGHLGSHHEEHHADQPDPSPCELLDQDTALATACAHLSCSPANLLNPKVELDEEDGRSIYEVEFCHNGTEYELELDACTGQVLKQDSEPCDRAGHGHGQSTGHHSGHHAEHH